MHIFANLDIQIIRNLKVIKDSSPYEECMQSKREKKYLKIGEVISTHNLTNVKQCGGIAATRSRA